MPDNVTISYRGANYEIGRAHGYYGIWRVGEARTQPLEWWPETTEGWYSAWSRFTALEVPGTIGPVSETAAAEAPVPRRPVLAALVVALGVLLGVVGLFPDYLSGASLASQPAELVPHVVYLAGWCASALVMVSGGSRWQIGALLSAGISVVSFGFFFADAGTAIADGAHVMGSGLVLSLVGWLACAAGSTIAVSLAREDFKTLRPRLEMFPLIAMALCAIGVAAAFAPSWDSYVLQAATGSSETLTAGNVFANPAPIIAGNVAVMIAIVAVAVVAAVWRPVLHGIVLLAGAIIPMAAQAISALVQVGQGATPAMFGISSSTATSTGLTITSGLTLAFWIYCIFVVLLVVAGVSLLSAPHPATEQAGWAGGGPAMGPQDTSSSGPASPQGFSEPTGEQFPGQAGETGGGAATSP